MLARPGLPSFDYVRAASADDACRLLQEDGVGVKLMAGGTDLFPRMRNELLCPKLVVDVKGIPGLREIAFDARGGLTIGAAVSLNRLAVDASVQSHFPLLAEAANSVASYQLRNRATLGGNLCNGSPAADMAPAALCLDAEVVLYSLAGLRTLRVRDLFVGPGTTAMAAGELMLAVRFPIPEVGGRGRYAKLGRNRAGDLAIVGVAVYGWPDQSCAAGCSFRIGLASVAPTPLRARSAEEVLAQDLLTPHRLKAAADAAAESTSPIDDMRASAAYRKDMVRNLVLRSLQDLTAQMRYAKANPRPGRCQEEA